MCDGLEKLLELVFASKKGDDKVEEGLGLSNINTFPSRFPLGEVNPNSPVLIL